MKRDKKSSNLESKLTYHLKINKRKTTNMKKKNWVESERSWMYSWYGELLNLAILMCWEEICGEGKSGFYMSRWLCWSGKR